MKGLEDPEPGIADFAKLFFTELSTKENVKWCMHIMRLTHVPQSTSTCQSANIPMTRRRSRGQQDIFSRSSKRLAPDNASTRRRLTLIQQKQVENTGFHLSEEPRQRRSIAVYLFIAVQVGSVSRFNDILAKVRPETFLCSAVANRISSGTAEEIGQ